MISVITVKTQTGLCHVLLSWRSSSNDRQHSGTFFEPCSSWNRSWCLRNWSLFHEVWSERALIRKSEIKTPEKHWTKLLCWSLTFLPPVHDESNDSESDHCSDDDDDDGGPVGGLLCWVNKKTKHHNLNRWSRLDDKNLPEPQSCPETQQTHTDTKRVSLSCCCFYFQFSSVHNDCICAYSRWFVFNFTSSN